MMPTVEILDTGATVYRGTRINLTHEVRDKNDEPYSVEGKEVLATIVREDRPSTEVFTDLAMVVAGPNSISRQLTAEESMAFEAPDNPYETYSYLVQYRIPADDFVSKPVRFYVGSVL